PPPDALGVVVPDVPPVPAVPVAVSIRVGDVAYADLEAGYANRNMDTRYAYRDTDAGTTHHRAAAADPPAHVAIAIVPPVGVTVGMMFAIPAPVVPVVPA